ncbi:MAG: MAPEG family protein [Pseudomonadota bacterium]
MTPELKWLALTCVLTTLMWVPYILNLTAVRGLMGAMGYPDDPKPMAGWADRLKKAHYNSVENLVVFGLLVVIAHLADIHTSWTVTACILYFWSRLAYAIIYAARIPVARTLAFAVSWLCILILAGAILL